MPTAAARRPSVALSWLIGLCASANAIADPAVQFVEVGPAAGVTALNRSGGTPKRSILETIGMSSIDNDITDAFGEARASILRGEASASLLARNNRAD